MCTTVLLIRHGTTDSNQTGILMGTLDIPLNQRGLRQAGYLGRYLEHKKIDAIYTSPLQRAAQTAGEVGRYLRITPIAVETLRELDAGALQGYSAAENRLRFPCAMKTMRDYPAFFQAPGGEATVDVCNRAVGTVTNLVGRHPHSTIAIISHGYLIETYLAYVRYGSLAGSERCIVGNCSVTTLLFNPGKPPVIEALGDDSFVPEDLRFQLKNPKEPV